MNITNDKRPMKEVLQDEIDHCSKLIEKLNGSTKTWSTTIGTLMMMDVHRAEKAIEDNDDSAMFRSYRALRLYNLPNPV